MAIAPAPEVPQAERAPRLGSLGAYALAVVATVMAILSQYFLPVLLPPVTPVYHSFVGGLLIVYGIPILAFATLVGRAPLRHWADRMATAAVEGFAWFGLLSLLAFAVLFALLIVYEAIDPAALRLLNRPNPALQAAAADPWFWVGFSFVIGAVEETIFRGWMFGYWVVRGTQRWWVPALWTSIVFAGVHLYYGTTYGAASPLLFPYLFLGGFAWAATVWYSRGNLVVVALLHGAFDASAFLTLVSPDAGDALRYGLIGAGLLVALAVWARGRRTDPAPAPPPAPWG